MSSISLSERINNLPTPVKAVPILLGCSAIAIGALGIKAIFGFGHLTLIGSGFFVGVGSVAVVGSLTIFILASLKKNPSVKGLNIPRQTVISISDIATINAKISFVEPQSVKSATGCTYAPSQDGILDFAGPLGRVGAHITDGTGKDNAANRVKLLKFCQDMEKNFNPEINNLKDVESYIKGYLDHLKKILQSKEVSVGAALSGTIICSINNEKYALVFNVGDNRLFHYSKGHSISLIPDGDPSLTGELSTSSEVAFIGILKVEDGDLLFGVTDGVYNNRAELFPFLLSTENPSELIQDLMSNITKKDDVGIFILKV